MITRNMTVYFGPVLCFLTLLVFCFDYVTGIGDVIYAINAGGEAHTDSLGVRYEKDPLQGKVGTASDYGKRLLIGRVPPNDHILYQTERYHHSTFGYDIPISEDGDYVMILKFCEVYFNAPNMKVSVVMLPIMRCLHVLVSSLFPRTFFCDLQHVICMLNHACQFFSFILSVSPHCVCVH